MKKKMLTSSVLSMICVFTFSNIVFACQPIVQLVMVFSGTTFLARSLIVLAIGVCIKCIVFALLEKNIPKFKAFYLMFWGNVASSISGIFLGILFSVPMLLPLIILVIYALVNGPAKRLESLNLYKFPKITAGRLTVFLTLLTVGTVILFGLAMANLELGKISLKYWIIKFAYVCLGVMISITISGLIEECVINWFINGGDKLIHYYPAVFRANFITFIIIIGYVALKTIPDRLNTPDWLIYSSLIIKLITW